MKISSPPGIKKISIFIFILIVLPSLLAYLIYTYAMGVVSDVKNFQKNVDAIEIGFIDSFPIYEDYATSEHENILRRFLFLDHMKVARDQGIGPVVDDEKAAEFVNSGKLVRLDPSQKDLFYFYNVRKSHRLLTPHGREILHIITERFQSNIRKKNDTLPAVKIAVSSMLRPVLYQSSLSMTNYNATIVSTHSYGVSFDIFFDDYYVVLPDPDGGWLTRNILEPMRRKIGFLLGDALRRQLRTVLMDTLIQLQEEGRIFAILERRQRCYHITALRSQ